MVSRLYVARVFPITSTAYEVAMLIWSIHSMLDLFDFLVFFVSYIEIDPSIVLDAHVVIGSLPVARWTNKKGGQPIKRKPPDI